MATSFSTTGAIDRALASVGTSTGTLTARDRTLIEALLVDRGVFARPSAAPGVFNPTPTPSPTPAPAPSGGGVVVNPIIRLALTTVQPGDLITAGFMNSLVEALLALDGRLSLLEGGDAPASPPIAPPPPPPPPPPPASLAPVIDSVSATIDGGEVTIEVTGTNIDDGQVRRVVLGSTVIDLATIAFDRAGFTFRTDTAALMRTRTPLTVTTEDGEDSALVTRRRI